MEALKGTLLHNSYKQPPYTQMSTKQLQKQALALAILHAEAVKHHASHLCQETMLVSTL